jgi:hypothetical protein
MDPVGAVPGTSSIGSAAVATSSPNRSAAPSATGAREPHRPSDSRRPSRNRSASRARRGVGPAEPMPVPTRPCSWSRTRANEQTAITMALRVPILANCCGPVAAGRWTATISSPGSRAVFLGPVKNSPGRDAPGPIGRGGLHLGLGGQQDRVAVAGRRGRAEVAPDGAPVADLRGADRPRGQREPGKRPGELGDEAGVGNAGPDPEPAVPAVPGRQLPDPGEVEQGRRPGAVEVQLHHHVGPAGDRDRLGPLGLGGQGFGQASRLQELHARSRGRGGYTPRRRSTGSMAK